MASRATEFARLTVRHVAAIDLTALSTNELNRLRRRFRWFRVEQEDGYEAVHIVNGLVAPVTDDVTVGGLTIRASRDEYSVEGDEALTADLTAAVAWIDAETARRMPQAQEAAWTRYRRYEPRQQRLDRGRLLDRVRSILVRAGARRRESRTRRTTRGVRSHPRRARAPDDPPDDDDPVGLRCRGAA